MRLPYLLLLLLSLFWACDSSQPEDLPSCLQNPSTPLHERMQKAVKTVIPQNLQTYQYSKQGINEEKDQMWNKVEKLTSSLYTQISITNIFQEGEQTEYYALEQQIDLRDTTNKQIILEYQFIVNADTAYILRVDEKELRYTGIEIGGNYLLEGYAHKGNTQPEQYRWWSPDCGDLLIWYGEKRFLKLQSPLTSDQKSQIQPSPSIFIDP